MSSPGRSASRSRTSSTTTRQLDRKLDGDRASCRAAQRRQVGQHVEAVRPSGPRRERTGPRPRSIASSSPRWSGICAATGTVVSRDDRIGPDPVAAHHQPQRRPGRGTARTGAPPRPAPRRSAPSARTPGRSAPPAPRPAGRRVRGRSTTTVSWPRWAAAMRVADGEGLEAALRSGVPGQHAEPVAPRQRLAQRAAAEPAGRLAQRVPPDAVVAVEPEDPVDARPERVGVDDDGRTRTGGHLARARTRTSRRRPRPSRRSRRRSSTPCGRGVADVGHQLGHPARRSAAARRRSRRRARARCGRRRRARRRTPRGARRTAAVAPGGPAPWRGRRRRRPGARRSTRCSAASGSGASAGVTPAAAASRWSSSMMVGSSVTMRGASMFRRFPARPWPPTCPYSPLWRSLAGQGLWTASGLPESLRSPRIARTGHLP